MSSFNYFKMHAWSTSMHSTFISFKKNTSTIAPQPFTWFISGRTVLVIAHRLSTIRDADIIAVVAGGKIVEVMTDTLSLSLEPMESATIQRPKLYSAFRQNPIFLKNQKMKKYQHFIIVRGEVLPTPCDTTTDVATSE